ncbi:MAG: hypothetical protein J5I98_12835, partial [Phaeodactylibacter sp.]|nr:hypothetical protein [Phaeodactylibacter sp.]
MRFIAKIPFTEVLEAFYREHSTELAHDENTNPEAERALNLANAQMGEWRKALVRREDILKVILPWHISCGGKDELVPKTGMTVGQAAAKIAGMGEAFAKHNPVCYQKIRRMARQPFTPLFLSTRAIEKDDYWDLERKDGLVHIDGLHRMIAWELYGRLSEEVEVEAYVAKPIAAEHKTDDVKRFKTQQ